MSDRGEARRDRSRVRPTHDLVRVLGVDADAAVVSEAVRSTLISYGSGSERQAERERDARLLRVVVAGEHAHVGACDAHQACEDESTSASLSQE